MLKPKISMHIGVMRAVKALSYIMVKFKFGINLIGKISISYDFFLII
jgi:hypothetical protein